MSSNDPIGHKTRRSSILKRPTTEDLYDNMDLTEHTKCEKSGLKRFYKRVSFADTNQIKEIDPVWNIKKNWNTSTSTEGGLKLSDVSNLSSLTNDVFLQQLVRDTYSSSPEKALKCVIDTTECRGMCSDLNKTGSQMVDGPSTLTLHPGFSFFDNSELDLERYKDIKKGSVAMDRAAAEKENVDTAESFPKNFLQSIRPIEDCSPSGNNYSNRQRYPHVNPPSYQQCVKVLGEKPELIPANPAIYIEKEDMDITCVPCGSFNTLEAAKAEYDMAIPDDKQIAGCVVFGGSKLCVDKDPKSSNEQNTFSNESSSDMDVTLVTYSQVLCSNHPNQNLEEKEAAGTTSKICTNGHRNSEKSAGQLSTDANNYGTRVEHDKGKTDAGQEFDDADDTAMDITCTSSRSLEKCCSTECNEFLTDMKERLPSPSHRDSPNLTDQKLLLLLNLNKQPVVDMSCEEKTKSASTEICVSRTELCPKGPSNMEEPSDSSIGVGICDLVDFGSVKLCNRNVIHTSCRGTESPRDVKIQNSTEQIKVMQAADTRFDNLIRKTLSLSVPTDNECCLISEVEKKLLDSCMNSDDKISKYWSNNIPDLLNTSRAEVSKSFESQSPVEKITQSPQNNVECEEPVSANKAQLSRETFHEEAEQISGIEVSFDKSFTDNVNRQTSLKVENVTVEEFLQDFAHINLRKVKKLRESIILPSSLARSPLSFVEIFEVKHWTYREVSLQHSFLESMQKKITWLEEGVADLEQKLSASNPAVFRAICFGMNDTAALLAKLRILSTSCKSLGKTYWKRDATKLYKGLHEGIQLYLNENISTVVEGLKLAEEHFDRALKAAKQENESLDQEVKQYMLKKHTPTVEQAKIWKKILAELSTLNTGYKECIKKQESANNQIKVCKKRRKEMSKLVDRVLIASVGPQAMLDSLRKNCEWKLLAVSDNVLVFSFLFDIIILRITFEEEAAWGNAKIKSCLLETQTAKGCRNSIIDKLIQAEMEKGALCYKLWHDYVLLSEILMEYEDVESLKLLLEQVSGLCRSSKELFDDTDWIDSRLVCNSWVCAQGLYVAVKFSPIADESDGFLIKFYFQPKIPPRDVLRSVTESGFVPTSFNINGECHRFSKSDAMDLLEAVRPGKHYLRRAMESLIDAIGYPF